MLALSVPAKLPGSAALPGFRCTADARLPGVCMGKSATKSPCKLTHCQVRTYVEARKGAALNWRAGFTINPVRDCSSLQGFADSQRRLARAGVKWCYAAPPVRDRTNAPAYTGATPSATRQRSVHDRYQHRLTRQLYEGPAVNCGPFVYSAAAAPRGARAVVAAAVRRASVVGVHGILR